VYLLSANALESKEAYQQYCLFGAETENEQDVNANVNVNVGGVSAGVSHASHAIAAAAAAAAATASCGGGGAYRTPEKIHTAVDAHGATTPSLPAAVTVVSLALADPSDSRLYAIEDNAMPLSQTTQPQGGCLGPRDARACIATNSSVHGSGTVSGGGMHRSDSFASTSSVGSSVGGGVPPLRARVVPRLKSPQSKYQVCACACA